MGHHCRSSFALKKLALGLLKLDAQLLLALPQLEFLVLQRVYLLVEGENLIE